MILKPLVKSINEGWTPQHLFQGTDLGLWYDISDRSTLFQDSDGNVPVTDYGQPVGLILDKSQGAKRELVHGGDFETKLVGKRGDGNGTTSTWTRNNVDPIEGGWDGRLEITVPGHARPIFYSGKTSKATVGYRYEMEFDYRVISGNMHIRMLYNGDSSVYVNQDLVGEGKFRGSVIAGGVSPNAGSIVYFTNSTGVIQIDNIKVFETRGHHAFQRTSTKRAIYARMPRVGIRNIIDNSDDGMHSSWVPSFTKAGGYLDSDGNYGATLIEGPSTGVPTKSCRATATGAHTLTLYVKAHPTRSPTKSFFVRNGTKVINYSGVSVDLSTGSITSGGSDWTVEPSKNGFYKLIWTSPSIIDAGDSLSVYLGAGGATNETFGLIVHKAQLEAGTTSTPHQTRVSQYDVYEQGQTHVDYLKFDGVDDWYEVSPTVNLGDEETKSASTSELTGQSVILSRNTGGYLGFMASTKKAFSHFSLDGSAGSRSNTSGTKVGVMRKTPNLVTFTSEESKKDHAGIITGFTGHISFLGSFNAGSSSITKGNIHQALAISRFITDEETNLLTKYLGSKAGVTEYVES